MRTLSLEEAVSGLGRWLELAIAGADIRIRKGDAVVELRPLPASGPPSSNEHLSPREALRRLQAEALRQGVGVVAEGSHQVEEEGLGLALFVALELGSELGEIPQTFFE